MKILKTCAIFFTFFYALPKNPLIICENQFLKKKIQLLLDSLSVDKNIIAILQTEYPNYIFKQIENRLYVKVAPLIKEVELQVPYAGHVEYFLIKNIKNKARFSEKFKDKFQKDLIELYKALKYPVRIEDFKIQKQNIDSNNIKLKISSPLKEYQMASLKVINSPIKIHGLPSVNNLYNQAFIIDELEHYISIIKTQLQHAGYKNVHVTYVAKMIKPSIFAITYNIKHNGMTIIDKINFHKSINPSLQKRINNFKGQPKEMYEFLSKLGLQYQEISTETGNINLFVFKMKKKKMPIKRIKIAQNKSTKDRYIIYDIFGKDVRPGDSVEIPKGAHYANEILTINAKAMEDQDIRQNFGFALSSKNFLEGSANFSIDHFNGLPQRYKATGNLILMLDAIIARASIPLDMKYNFLITLFKRWNIKEDSLLNYQNVVAQLFGFSTDRIKFTIELQKNTGNFINLSRFVYKARFLELLTKKGIQNLEFYPTQSIYLQFTYNFIIKKLHKDFIHYISTALYLGIPTSALGIQYSAAHQIPLDTIVIKITGIIGCIIGLKFLEESHAENLITPIFLHTRAIPGYHNYYYGAKLNLECKYNSEISIFNYIELQPTGIIEYNLEKFSGYNNHAFTISMGLGSYVNLKILPKFRIMIGQIFGTPAGIDADDLIFGFRFDLSAAS